MKNPHRQVILSHEKITLVGNLPDHPKLKRGNYVTLKDDPSEDVERRWFIEWVSKNLTDKSKLNRGWHNNI